MRLIIVESPAKCQKIQGFLGLGNKVIASMGHIRALVQDIDAVGITKGFEPTYEFIKEKARAIAQLRLAAKDADSIVLCADDDREGEAIAYSVCLLLKLDPKTNPRAAFREITRNAVLDAVSNPRTIDMNKVNSQQARAMLDMMVGFTISPLLWKYVAPALSAGRCQTPALRIVCEQEAAIEAFKTEASYLIDGTWSQAAGAVSGFVWPASMLSSLSDEESALNYLENHSTEASAKVSSNVVKPWSESAPKALMTSTLQQQASNLYHCAPKRTMQIAQKLYEAGHITYMRTDQTTMSEEAQGEAKKIVESRWGKSYVCTVNGTATKKAKDSGEPEGTTTKPPAQEAHEAIRPTHFELSRLPEKEDWSTYDLKIYHLIWLRAIQSVMAPARGESRVVRFDAEGDDGDFPWEAKWRRTIFPGWKAADERDVKIAAAEGVEAEEDTEDSNDWTDSGKILPGDSLKWKTLKAKPHETKPPGRYTEASLVRELEKKGIGRPSTFASLIATINEKAYVEVKDIPAQITESKAFGLSKLYQWPPTATAFPLKQGGEKTRMVPTALGREMLAFAVKHFPDLFAFDFTAGMESRLDKIAEGAEPWKSVLSETWNSYKDRIANLKSATGTSGDARKSGNVRRREFGDGLVAVISAKGPLLLREGETKEDTVFFGWPAGGSGKLGFSEITEEQVKSHVASFQKEKTGDMLGEFEGHSVIRKKGPYGTYIEWNGIRVTCTADDTIASLSEKIRAKRENPARTVGTFQIRTGPYGPYLLKTGATGKGKPQYVSIPKGTDIENLTAQQAGEIFEAGLKAKAASGGRGGRGGFRGGFRGGSRGGGRGGAHGG